MAFYLPIWESHDAMCTFRQPSISSENMTLYVPPRLETRLSRLLGSRATATDRLRVCAGGLLDIPVPSHGIDVIICARRDTESFNIAKALVGSCHSHASGLLFDPYAESLCATTFVRNRSGSARTCAGNAASHG
jgi:hypothetical protein